MGSASPPINVAIIGGGIGGLALAAGLSKKPHLTVHVYEGVPEYKDVGAGLALHKNAIGAMSLLGPEVRKAYFDKAINIGEDEDDEMATEVILAHGPHTGQLVAELGRAKGRKSVSRADLLAGFLDLIPKQNISFGKKLALIEETDPSTPNPKVHLTFQDGTKVQSDCVLGADGIHSMVRSHLLGSDHPATLPKNHDNWQVFRTLVSTSEAITTHGINPRWAKTVPIMTGPQGHINVIPLNKGTRLSAGVAVRGLSTPSSSSSPNPTLDPTLYSTYHPQALSLVQMIASPSTPSTTWSIGDHDHAPFYHKSRIAILGDAAHASLPFAGNGAAQALEDAAVLDHLFSRVKSPSQIKAALAAYDAVRRKRSQEVVELSRRFGRVYAHCSDGEIYGDGEERSDTPLVEDPERLREFFAKAAAFTNNFDLKKQNDEAMEVYEGLVRGRSRSCGQGPGN